MALSGSAVPADVFLPCIGAEDHCIGCLHRGIDLEETYNVTGQVSVTWSFLLLAVYNSHILTAPEMPCT